MAKYIFAQLVDLSYVRYLPESHHSLTGLVYGVFDSEEKQPDSGRRAGRHRTRGCGAAPVPFCRQYARILLYLAPAG